MSELILYQTDDGQAEVRLRAEGGSVWLSQVEIAELFATTKQNVSLHAKSIVKEGELASEATVKESLTVQNEGGRLVKRHTLTYNLPMILAVICGSGPVSSERKARRVGSCLGVNSLATQTPSRQRRLFAEFPGPLSVPRHDAPRNQIRKTLSAVIPDRRRQPEETR